MNRLFLSLGMGLFLSLAAASSAIAAAEPTSIDQDSRVDWSKVISDPFDGQIVYDKNFGDDFAFVSSWARSGIRLTYFKFWKEIVGYNTVWRTRTVTVNGKDRQESYPSREPIYEKRSRRRSPDKIMLAINGQVYNYDGGPVAPELATVLASAPSGNVRIRMVWADGSTSDSVIGAGTVAAWKSIFQP